MMRFLSIIGAFFVLVFIWMLWNDAKTSFDVSPVVRVIVSSALGAGAGFLVAFSFRSRRHLDETTRKGALSVHREQETGEWSQGAEPKHTTSNSQSSFDEEWETLLAYDEDFRNARKEVVEYGEEALAELKRAYGVIRDRTKISNIAQTIRAQWVQRSHDRLEQLRRVRLILNSPNDETALDEAARLFGLALKKSNIGIAVMRGDEQIQFCFNEKSLRAFLASYPERE